MTRCRIIPAAALLLLAAHPVRAQEAGGTARRAVAKTAVQSEDRALLHQIAEAQRGLGEQMQGLKEQIEGLRSELATAHDQETGRDEELKVLRDEVKGLYVENSSLKQQIDALRQDVSGVNSNVSSFRGLSGFFIAVMILLLAVIFMMTVRR